MPLHDAESNSATWSTRATAQFAGTVTSGARIGFERVNCDVFSAPDVVSVGVYTARALCIVASMLRGCRNKA